MIGQPQKGVVLIDDSLGDLRKCSEFLTQRGILVAEKILFQPDGHDQMVLACSQDSGVTTCGDGDDLEAYIRANADHYDGVVTDLELSEFKLYSGRSMVAFIRSELPDLPVVIHSRVGRDVAMEGDRYVLLPDTLKSFNEGVVKKNCAGEHLYLKQELGLASPVAEFDTAKAGKTWER